MNLRKRPLRHVFAWALTVSALLAAGAAHGRTWIEAADYDALRLVLPAEPTALETRAAGVFASYWERVTGHAPAKDTEAGADSVNVWVGRAAARWVDEDELEALGGEGVLLRTRRRLKGVPGKAHLLLTGGPQRGVLYAAHQFLEDRLGVRWLTPEATHIPPPPKKMNAIDFTYVPPFQYRDISYPSFVNDPDFAAAHKLNGFFSAVPDESGGHHSYVYGHTGFGHTFHLFVDPGEHFDKHPEYFSEVGGRRIREETQLCLSNPGVLAMTIEGVREWLRKAMPHERIVSVSQMDWGNGCACQDCAATDAREGSASGSLIRFVNSVAAAIEDEFPDVLVDTFAYRYTRKPPRHVRPRHNVIVRVCTIECDFSVPIGTRRNTLNRAFHEDLALWAAITRHLYIWDYTQNWYFFQAPHPNLHVFAPNARLFARYGVEGVFGQASLYTPHADFEHLKAYVLAKLLWNPEANAEALRGEFLRLYYGDAAPYLAAYLDGMERHVRSMDAPLTMYNTLDWLEYDLVLRSLELFGRAYEATGDPLLRERLDYARLSVQFAALVCPGRVREKSGGYVIDRPPGMAQQAYWDLLMEYGVSHVADHTIERLWRRLPVNEPPRHEETRLEKLRTEQHEVWVAPSLGGAVLRFAGRRTGTDLLRGVEGLAAYSGRIGEWFFSVEDAPDRYETPVTRNFEVVARGENEVTLRYRYGTGLVTEKRIALREEAPHLVIETSYHNDGEKDFVLYISQRAEWSTHGGTAPELWLEGPNGWRVRPMPEAAGPRDFSPVPVKPGQGWGFRLPGESAGVTCRAGGSHIGWTALRHLPELEELVFEASPGFVPMAPGARVTFNLDFTWITEPPR